MKTTAIMLSTGQHDPALDILIEHKDAMLKDGARKNARHFAERNLPKPDDQNLNPYVGEIKSGYEALAAELMQRLQPASHFPESKMDADFLKEKDKTLDAEIKKREDQNRNDAHALGRDDTKALYSRIRLAVIITSVIAIGEILYNSKAFQIIGENMLFALILSISISVAVLVFAHFATFLFKAAKTKIKRRLIVIGALCLVTGLFIALSILRSEYLALHGVQVSPVYFVIINVFFFVVNGMISLYLMPTWMEVKENHQQMKIVSRMEKREKEIKSLKGEKEHIKEIVLERTKYRVRINYYASYINERVRKLYFECVGIFKSTNLTYRTDGEVPYCFTHETAHPDIEQFSFEFTPSKLN